MKKIDSLLADYASYHQTRGNVICHFIGIPLIMFSIFVMLQNLPLFSIGGFAVTASELLLFLASLYYLVLDLRLAAGIIVISVGLDAIARFTPDLRIGIAIFIVGWIFQGIGHIVYEKKSPAFLRNLVHLLIGPIFLLNELFLLGTHRVTETRS